MSSGWACNNSISATITKRWMWFITWISFSPPQEDTWSVYTLMSYTVRIKQKGIFFGNYYMSLKCQFQSLNKMEDQHLKWEQNVKNSSQGFSSNPKTIMTSCTVDANFITCKCYFIKTPFYISKHVLSKWGFYYPAISFPHKDSGSNVLP